MSSKNVFKSSPEHLGFGSIEQNHTRPTIGGMEAILNFAKQINAINNLIIFLNTI